MNLLKKLVLVLLILTPLTSNASIHVGVEDIQESMFPNQKLTLTPITLLAARRLNWIKILIIFLALHFHQNTFQMGSNVLWPCIVLCSNNTNNLKNHIHDIQTKKSCSPFACVAIDFQSYHFLNLCKFRNILFVRAWIWNNAISYRKSHNFNCAWHFCILICFAVWRRIALAYQSGLEG